jgi:hypothetical protein
MNSNFFINIFIFILVISNNNPIWTITHHFNIFILRA